MKKLHHIAFLALSIFFMRTVSADDNASNCKQNEKILFSCSTGNKFISFCATPEGHSPQYLEYRYGNSKKMELTFKSEGHDSSNKFHRSEVLGASGSATRIWFENNGFGYILTDPIKGKPTLEIMKEDKLIKRFICEKDFFGDTDMPSIFIE